METAKIFILAFLGVISSSSSYNHNITSPPITDWGVWGSMSYCPFGRQAQGFQLRTESNQFLGDDTALNTIRLFCGEPTRPDTAVITGLPQGLFGTWGKVYTCAPGVLNGFQLRSESNRGSGDDTAANNIRFFCSSLPPSDYIQGDGMSWGDWTAAPRCHNDQGICGIQTQIEPYMADDGDDTMLNNVRFECCDMNMDLTPAQLSAAAAHNKETITTVADLKIFPGAKIVNIPKLRQALAAINSQISKKTL